MSCTHFSPELFVSAETKFLQTYPQFQLQQLAQLRTAEYGRLDGEEQVYLDYTGGGLHAACQIESHMRMLTSRVLGNPHSHNPTSLAMTELVESARAYVLDYFNASPDDYICIFTPNASGALRLVGEAYNFSEGSKYLLSFDNHNSVNGIRLFAQAKGATVEYVPVTAPDLRLALDATLAALENCDNDHNNLFAFPAQSNFSGVKHPLSLVEAAHERCWDVLLDCAAFAPTNRCDISLIRPDFATFSFYKMFGYPTGIGCLLARRDKLHKLDRPWFAGGTIKIASVQGDGHYLHDNEAAFEDGTVDYLNIPAVEIGLRHLESIGIDNITTRVECLTAWLLDAVTELKHSTGQPLVQLLGPANSDARGGTVTMALQDCHGVPIDDQRVEQLANDARISLRTGCFCNPGAGEVAFGLTSAEMVTFFEQGEPFTFSELRSEMLTRYEKAVGAIRVSVGVATNFADVYALASFLESFVDRHSVDIGRCDTTDTHHIRETA